MSSIITSPNKRSPGLGNHVSPVYKNAFRPLLVLPKFSQDQKWNGFKYFIFTDSLSPVEIIDSPIVRWILSVL